MISIKMNWCPTKQVLAPQPGASPAPLQQGQPGSQRAFLAGWPPPASQGTAPASLHSTAENAQPEKLTWELARGWDRHARARCSPANRWAPPHSPTSDARGLCPVPAEQSVLHHAHSAQPAGFPMGEMHDLSSGTRHDLAARPVTVQVQQSPARLQAAENTWWLSLEKSLSDEPKMRFASGNCVRW